MYDVKSVHLQKGTHVTRGSVILFFFHMLDSKTSVQITTLEFYMSLGDVQDELYFFSRYAFASHTAHYELIYETVMITISNCNNL